MLSAAGPEALGDVKTDPGRPDDPAGLPRADKTARSPSCTEKRPEKVPGRKILALRGTQKPSRTKRAKMS